MAWVGTFFFGIGLYIVLVGEFKFRLPLLTISGTAPSHLFALFALFSGAARVVGPLAWNAQPLPRLYLAFLSLGKRQRIISLVSLSSVVVLLILGRLYQTYYISEADRLMARGEAIDSAEYYRRAARWPFGKQEYAKAYRSCMLFGAGQFNQCVDENLPDFRDGVDMRSTRYRCLWSCLGELERYEEALEVVETSLSKNEKMVKYAPAAEHFRRLIKKNDGASGRRTPVQFSWKAEKEEALRIRGSFTEAGRQSEVDGWKFAHPMNRSGEAFTATIPLGLSGRLPYAAVLEARDGENWSPVAMSHFWNTGDEDEVRPLVRPIVESEPPPSGPWKRAPADGRKRTIVIWPDGGAWFFLHTLIERGGLPRIKSFLETAAQGKMLSTHPPLTATAYLKMVRILGKNDRRVEDRGFFKMLALQLKGIPFLDWAFDDEVASLGDDPLSIFNILRKNGYSAVNLVFSDKYMSAPDDAGQAATGSKGGGGAFLGAPEILKELSIDRSKEPSRAARVDSAIAFIQAYNNTAEKAKIGEQVWKSGEHDFMLLRFPAVDLMSHKYAADAFDDAMGNLMLETYRQFDIAFGTFMDLVDEDDTLVLVSDHGVEGALAHHPDCVLAVSGPNVTPGARLPQVSIGQLPHLLLSRFGIATGGFNEELRAALSASPP